MIQNEQNSNGVFFIKVGRSKGHGKFISVEPKEILYVEASRSYCDVHLIDRKITLSIPLNRFLELSGGVNFRRISRHVAVNLIAIKEIHTWKVVLSNGIDLKITTNYLSDFYGSINLIGGDAPKRIHKEYTLINPKVRVRKFVKPQLNKNSVLWSDDEIEVVHKLYMSIDRSTQYETFNKVYMEMQQQDEFPKRNAETYYRKLRQKGLLKQIHMKKMLHPWTIKNQKFQS